ncbi:MAG: transporter substrate-binding domain-containing protein [bacterium]
MRRFLPKILFIGMFLSVAIFPLAEREAGTVPDPLTPEERAFVAAHGPIRYAPDPLFAPFEFLSPSGVAEGITPDLLAIMGKKMGVEFRTVAYPTWSDVLDAAKRREVDLLGTLTRTPEREGFLIFSEPYLSVPYVLFVREGGGDGITIEDLVSRRLGVVKNYGINTWLSAEHPKTRPVMVEDAATGLTMVATGQLDALLEALPVGARIVREKSLTNIRIVPRHIYTLPQHFGVPKGEPLLLSIIQKGMNSLTEAERSEVFVRWTGQDFSRPPPVISPLLRNALLVLAAAAVLSWVWIVALRRSVRRATQSLRESEERFRTLSELSPLGMALIDPRGRYEYVNPAFVSIFGYTLEEVPTGALWFRAAFPDPELRKEVIRAWKEDLAGSRVGEARPRTYDVTCKDGTRKIVQFRPVSLSRDRQFVIYEDMTRQRELQAQLQQAMKMEAVGRLAGGVAHDFNNILTVIMGNVSMALGKLPPSDPAAGLLSEAQKGAERAALLTRQLLAFSRKQIIEPKVLDLNALITDMGKMLVRLIGEDIVLKIHPGEGLGPVKVDHGQFEQVLVNLAVNARDAMPGGGTLLIETANTDLDESYCILHPYVLPGRFVMLAVSDTGCGMPAEVRKQIFEPFFTTKPKGTGTGLGLAMIYGVVKNSNGSIEVYSEVGKGTTFKIYLPRIDGEAAETRVSDPPKEAPSGSGTVLLVEDETMVRNLGVRILERSGYKVLQAGNGDEAIALATGYGERIDLLLTDVVMPGMSGREMANRLTRIHPETRVLFTSGYTDDAIVHHGVLDEGVSFIGKPYTPSTLSKKVREVLDKG